MMKANGARVALPVVLALMLAGVGCTQASSHAERERVDAQQEALAAYQPRLCIEWTGVEGNPSSSCESTVDIRRMYDRGMNEAAGKRFSAIYFEAPPDANPARSLLDGWSAQSTKLAEFLKAEWAMGSLVQGSVQRQAREVGRVRDRQNALLGELENAKKDAGGALRDQVTKYVETQTGFPAAVLAVQRQGKASVDPIVAATRTSLAPLALEMRTKLIAFDAFRKSETAYRASLEDIAKRASTATFETLPGVEHEMTQLQSRELAKCDALSIDIRQSIIPVLNARSNYETAVAPYRDFLAINYGHSELLQGFQDLVDSGRNAVAYVEGRRRVGVEAARKLQQGMAQRRAHLMDVAANRATEATLGPARFNLLASQFLNEVNERIESLRAPSETSTRLRLPFLLAKVDRNYNILDLASLCSATPTPDTAWMKAGCDAVAAEVTKARTQLDLSIPAAVKVGALALRRSGVSAEVTAEIDAHVAAKKTREAALAYDSVLRMTDRLPTQDGGTP